jgi:hypothetical protein
MSNSGHPNDVEYLLVGTREQEKLQHLADSEVSKDGRIDLWPEHWEDSGAKVLWNCVECGRLYLNATEDLGEIIVYKIEKQGLSN